MLFTLSPQGVFMRLLHDKPEVAVRQNAKAAYRLGVLCASVAVNEANGNGLPFTNYVT